MAKSLIVAAQVASASSTAGTVGYWTVIGFTDKTTSTTDKEMPINRNGILSKLSIHVNSSSVAGGSVTFTLMKNGSPTALTVTTPNPPTAATYYEDLTHTVTVAAGDKFMLKADPGSTTGTHNIAHVQMLFEPDDIATKTVSFFGGAHGSSRTLSTASTSYFYPITTYLDALTTTENICQIEMRVSGTFKNLAANVLSNARTTDTTITLRKNGADGGLILTYLGTGSQFGYKADTTNSVSVVAGDLICIKIATGSGSGNFNIATFNLEFENTDSPGVHFHMGSNYNLIGQSRNQTLYGTLGGWTDLTTSETNFKMRLVEGGFTARNLGVRISANAVASASTFLLRKTAADTALVVSIGSTTADWLEDTTHSVALSSGDEINAKFVIGIGSGSQTITWKNWTVYLDATNPTSGTNTTVTPVVVVHQRPIKLLDL